MGMKVKKVVLLLKEVPKDYDQTITILKEKEHIPKLEDTINSIQEEDKKIKAKKMEDHWQLHLAKDNASTTMEGPPLQRLLECQPM